MRYTIYLDRYGQRRSIKVKLTADSMSDARAAALAKHPGCQISMAWYDWPQPLTTGNNCGTLLA
jgi:hypothetical protein